MTKEATERLQKLTGGELAEIVKRYIDAERVGDPIFNDIPFAVDGNHVARAHDQVRIPVRALRNPIRSGYLYGFIADVNVHLMDGEGLNIFLSPVDWEETT